MSKLSLLINSASEESEFLSGSSNMTDNIRVVKPDQDANVKCSIQVPGNVEDPRFVVSIFFISYVGFPIPNVPAESPVYRVLRF